MDECLVADLFELASELVILLLQFLDVLVLDRDGAAELRNLIKLELELDFVISANLVELCLLLSKVKLCLFELCHELFVVWLRVKLGLDCLVLVTHLNDLRLCLGAIVLVFGLELSEAHRLLTQPVHHVLHLGHLFFGRRLRRGRFGLFLA